MTVESHAKGREAGLERRAELFKALADPTRLQVVNALLERPHCAEELSGRLRRAPSTISFHLRKLEEAGLVAKTKSQYYLVYELRTDLFAKRLRELVALPAAEDSPERRRLLRMREQVRKAYFRNGFLERIPKQWRKRLVILEEVLEKFEPGRVYAEREVDERIKTLCADYCTIRRMLIDEGMMTRRNGEYRRAATEEPTMSTRAELKRQYKEAPRKAGIYRILNTVTGRALLGAARNLAGPLNRHRFELNIGKHRNAALQADWDTYGAEAFKFEVVDEIEVKDDPAFDLDGELALLEEAWIERTQPFFERTYNKKLSLQELDC